MPSIKYPVAIFNRCEMRELKAGVNSGSFESKLYVW
jgi:hypothetical protein